MCVLILCGIAGVVLQTAPKPLLCAFLCARLWKLHGLVLGAVVWEDVRGKACESALKPCNLSLPGPQIQATLCRLDKSHVSVSVFSNPEVCLRSRYCIRSSPRKMSKSPAAKDAIRAFALLLNRLTVKDIKKRHSVRPTVNGRYPQLWLSHQLQKDLRRY